MRKNKNKKRKPENSSYLSEQSPPAAADGKVVGGSQRWEDVIAGGGGRGGNRWGRDWGSGGGSRGRRWQLWEEVAAVGGGGDKTGVTAATMNWATAASGWGDETRVGVGGGVVDVVTRKRSVFFWALGYNLICYVNLDRFVL